MIRAVRNFWLELNVDGRQSIATGPKTREGGFNLTIKMRDNGDSKKAASITGYALADGRLILDFWEGTTRIHRIETKR